MKGLLLSVASRGTLVAAGQIIGLGKNGGFYFNGGGEQTFSGVNFGGNVQVGVFRRKAGSTYADSEFMFNGANQIGTAISGTSTPSIPNTGRDMLIGAGRNGSGAISSQLGNAVLQNDPFEGDLNDFAVRRLEGYLAYKWGSSQGLRLVILWFGRPIWWIQSSQWQQLMYLLMQRIVTSLSCLLLTPV